MKRKLLVIRLLVVVAALTAGCGFECGHDYGELSTVEGVIAEIDCVGDSRLVRIRFEDGTRVVVTPSSSRPAEALRLAYPGDYLWMELCDTSGRLWVQAVLVERGD